MAGYSRAALLSAAIGFPVRAALLKDGMSMRLFRAPQNVAVTGKPILILTSRWPFHPFEQCFN
jgi:hypothetical protein